MQLCQDGHVEGKIPGIQAFELLESICRLGLVHQASLWEAGGDWQNLDLTTMENTRISRNHHFQRKALELSGLNDDVLFEILLQFVAVDWDGGPFTLMLVSTKWQKLALSQTRLWTWMLVDDSQTDWKERMEVAAYLSRGLPLQICLRLRFTTDIPLSHVVRRCETLRVDYRHLYSYFTTGRWQSGTTTIYEAFYWSRDILKELNNDVMRFLADVSTSQIKILSADPDREYFRYSAREIYEGITSGNSIRTLLQMVHPFLLTALVFKHGKATKSQHVHFEIGEVWAILPTLPHLSHLELYDTFVNLDRRTVLPYVCLPSLRTLIIDCPMSHWVFFSFAHDIWLGLLNILSSLDAPIIEAMMLHSSVQRIRAAMMKATTRPSNLTLTISTFDEAEDGPEFDQDWIWTGLTRTTINLPETANAFSRLAMPDGLVSAILSLLSFLPKGTLKRFRGGGELDAIAQAYISDIEDLDLFYTHSRPLQYTFQAESVVSLTVKTYDGLKELFGPPYASPPPYVRWLKSIEHISLEGEETVGRCFDAYLSHVVEPALKSWDSHEHSGWFYDGEAPSTRRASFSFLTTLRSCGAVASELVRLFDTPSLHSITLVDDFDDGEYFLSILPETLSERAFQLKQLKILGMEFIPDWSRLFSLLSNFQTPGLQISMIILPGLPHPSILQQLVAALQGGSPDHSTWTDLYEIYSKRRTAGTKLCDDCSMSGFSCYDTDCRKFWPGKMVSITKDTVIGHYYQEMALYDGEHSADPIE